jgi:hypothetical protein
VEGSPKEFKTIFGSFKMFSELAEHVHRRIFDITFGKALKS